MTEDLGRNSKTTKIKEILPILWSSYEHMFESRETGVRNNINFLLIVVSFLPVICLALYDLFTSPLFLVPTLFQVTALLILLKSFFIKGQIPWLEFKETLSQLDDDTFEAKLFASLKAAENGTYIRMGALSTVIKRAVFLLIFSIFLILLACLFMFLKGSILLYVVTVLLVFVFSLLYFFYKDVPNFEFSNEYEEFKSHIEKWLKDEKKEKNTGSGRNS